MSEKTSNNEHRETVERFCHIIGKNTAVSRKTTDGVTVYECMNKHSCEQCGGCKNERYGKK